MAEQADSSIAACDQTQCIRQCIRKEIYKKPTWFGAWVDGDTKGICQYRLVPKVDKNSLAGLLDNLLS